MFDYKYFDDLSIELIDGDRGKNYPKNDEMFEKGYCLFLNAKNVTLNGFAFDENVFITKEKDEILRKGKLNRNDIVLTTRGTIGNVGLYDDKITYDNVRINSGMLIIRNNDDNINTKYLYYQLTSPFIRNQIFSLKTGSAQPQIPITVLKKLKLIIPDKRIQDKIVRVMDSIINKLTLNNEINNNLYDLGKSYFEDFISNCDREVAIKDIADEVLDYTKNKNDKVKLLNSSDVTENIFPKVEFVDNKDLKGHFKKRFKKHDILYSQIRPRNHHYGYVLLHDSENYLASTRFMVVRNKKEKVSSSLLYYYLTSKNAVEDFTTKTELRSGTFPQGNYEDLSSYVVKYSSNQESITKILDLILETINNNNNENEKLSELRDTLLPKLMNGKIDLDNIEI